MITSRFRLPRLGRLTAHEHLLMLAIVVAACIAVVRLAGVQHPGETRSLWDRVFISLIGVLQCGGLFIVVGFILATIEALKQTLHRYHHRRVEGRLFRLRELLRCVDRHANPSTFRQVLSHLQDAHEGVRQQAMIAIFNMLRVNPDLNAGPTTRDRMLRALLSMPGFARTLAETPLDADLLHRITLGAKLGAGTAAKRLAPVTSVPLELACWVEQHRQHLGDPEIQISIGYDTGCLPSLAERGRFLALYLFIATTDLQRFQALLRRPPRDPNAAYGLLIRGDLLEVRFPGQVRGHRLDYVFPLPVRLSQANLAGLFREIQVLNLGMLLGCVADACRVLAGPATPDWLDERRQAVAGLWREFERRFVQLLRRFDRYRDPTQIHRLVPADDVERRAASERYHLEESLYPHFGWVVPLYDPDTRWDRLILPLRCVEGMLLHQGEVEGREVTRGMDFIGQVRKLGYQISSAIEQALAGELPTLGPQPLDPFIDPADEESTRWYLRQVSQAIGRGEISPFELPDPATFRRAQAYYEIGDSNYPTCTRNHSEEVDP